jgi:hypothetical protein
MGATTLLTIYSEEANPMDVVLYDCSPQVFDLRSSGDTLVTLYETEAQMVAGAGIDDLIVSRVLRGAAPYVPPTGVYPVIGHVRASDQYGPTGTEYTGTEVLPTEAQVEKNVQYGAGGTEFTGTLEGGGGPTKRRVRSVM